MDEEPIGPEHDLADEDEWWSFGTEEPKRVVAVRDLDLVADDKWPDALRLLALEPATWQALREPGGYTAWWISRYALLEGRAPRLAYGFGPRSRRSVRPASFGAGRRTRGGCRVRTHLEIKDASDASDCWTASAMLLGLSRMGFPYAPTQLWPGLSMCRWSTPGPCAGLVRRSCGRGGLRGPRAHGCWPCCHPTASWPHWTTMPPNRWPSSGSAAGLGIAGDVTGGELVRGRNSARWSLPPSCWVSSCRLKA
ncbi:hypothetical protein [Kibdelosporangium philippinense]|uniref:hypothetical protein n=1 Tax=Kibdelosporangium philippinense TaxID=211113 RepID=UPI0036176FED